IQALIVHHLSGDGFRCRTAGDGAQALALLRARVPDLVVLDLMLPGIDGLELTRRVRAEPAWARLPMIMLTAKGDEIDRIVGLEMGADDYIAKPFSPKELLARVRAVLRRAQPADDDRALAGGGIILDPARHRVTLDGAPVDLTPKEFDLLHALMDAAGRRLSRRIFPECLWGDAPRAQIEAPTGGARARPPRRPP